MTAPYAKEATIPALRNLIDRIILTPAKSVRGVETEVQDRLAAIICLAMGKPVEQERTFQMERVKGIEPSS
ncbi:hypothetical protein NZL82_00245 [Sphingomonas sanguinis]|uniref:hypothetical protein n=1 Tax=Sphingomonas sp. LC-1 TaxID=3110957 RepID=UPI0021BB8C52|nr:hypothetical protein [Sphingomonas sp. LC-1]MCT8000303.1 hypothetical protein [Sphingomonas sp. LC-1]